MEDPNPIVAGRGIKKLQESGIEVVLDVLKEEPGKTIFWIIFGVVVVAYYTIMTIMMINGDKKNLDSNKE